MGGFLFVVVEGESTICGIRIQYVVQVIQRNILHHVGLIGSSNLSDIFGHFCDEQRGVDLGGGLEISGPIGRWEDKLVKMELLEW